MSLGNDEFEEEMRKARQLADRLQAQYDRDQEVEYEREYGADAYAHEEREASLRLRKNGLWRFEPMFNNVGEVIGWNVGIDGAKCGIIIVRGDDLIVLSTSTDKNALRKAGVMHLVDDPSPAEIMSAFLKLYPGGAPEARRLRSEQPLPAFGPPRDWSEGD